MSDTVNIKVWTKRGNMYINTSALPYDDPDHEYNQIVAMGLIPEDFGIKHPLEHEFGNKSRGELIAEIMQLRKELLSYVIHGK